jgi:hypothetical protein
MDKIIFKCPINPVSFGNVSLNLMREMYNRGMQVAHFPIGNPDAQVYDKLSPEFREWLQQSVNHRLKLAKKDIPTLQLWHINGSENRISKEQFLFTFYEVSEPTLVEKNLVDMQSHVFFSSTYSAKKFESVGCENVSYIPVGFDTDFHKTGKTYLKDKIHFGLMGKFEKRKMTAQILRAWAKTYGNNFDYQLSCCINNSFLKPEELNGAIHQALDGQRYGNINFLPFLKTNSEVNEFMNAIDIDLSGLSGAEGWNLPAFNATALGKWSVVLNATSHKDWATPENSLLVEPNGTVPSADGRFFHQGSDFNQGVFYTFDEDAVIAKMKEAEAVCKTENTKGLELQESFSYSNTLDKILDRIN